MGQRVTRVPEVHGVVPADHSQHWARSVKLPASECRHLVYVCVLRFVHFSGNPLGIP